MTSIRKSTAEGNASESQIDLREQVFNDRATGPIERVALPAEAITRLHGIVLDLDPHLFRSSEYTGGAGKGPKSFLRMTVSRWLRNHPLLSCAEVRSTGRGLHVIIWLEEPICFESDCDRQRWDGIIRVVQAVLPVDPDQPALTTLTRPVGSINGKNGRAVGIRQQGTPVPVGEVLRIYDQMASAPFRTVMAVLFGSDRVTPCPVCQTEGSSLAALDRTGRCYGSCGTVALGRLYDVFLVPRTHDRKEAGHGER